MRKILYIAATALLCASCFHVNTNYKGGKNAIKGEGNVISKSFDFKDFDKIVINGHADVDFTQSSIYEVTVRTQENVFEWLDYKVDGNTLIIETKDHREIRATKYDLVIQAPDLTSIQVNGASDFDIPAGLMTQGSLKIQVNGAGDLTFNQIVCKSLSVEVNGAADATLTELDVLTDLKVEVNGAGDVTLTGHTENVSLSVNGAGAIDAKGLQVDGEVKKHAAGIAKISI